ncbi:tRNA pseudouridine(13) synthase TruD [Methanomicrobium mobile]|uniref:tRNA pseudouridine(13) synthase TruD n=1 Tax=Methanomicrobium mobile TaxID=2205 RepID=UPI0005B28A2E|nr:tRNA pseudouridine(13) synthase TruD [Methanomicrobium mobile]
MTPMKSPYGTEQLLGMEYYLTKSAGTGGILRKTPEDFAVEEVYSDIKLTGGPHLICELEKTNWELMRALKEISKTLGVSYQRISFAGTKDKRAVTKQLISIYGIKEEDLARVMIKDINLRALGYARTQLSLGDLKGNSFGINVSDCTGDDLEGALEECIAAAKTGLPNYYGIQRFGTIRPISHIVGIALLKGDFKDACMKYAGYPFDDEAEEVKAAREVFERTGDAADALELMPVRMHYERSILHHLVEKPGDYKGAIGTIPPKLLSMFVSAVQSYIFNRVLSMRIRETDGDPFSPQIGDRLLFADGREDIVTAANINAANIHIKRGRCRTAIYMPGSEDFEPKSETERYTADLMAECGVTKEAYADVSKLVGSRFAGASRAMCLTADIAGAVNRDGDERSIRLEFSLPPGHYATTVCRELMKTDPGYMA